MNRRSVLGFLGLAPAIGSQLSNKLSSSVQQTAYSSAPDYPLTICESPADIKKSFVVQSKRLLDFINNKEDNINEVVRHNIRFLNSNPNIDVDILAMKSISDINKIHMQARRNAERDFEDRKGDLQASVKYYMEQLGLKV